MQLLLTGHLQGAYVIASKMTNSADTNK